MSKNNMELSIDKDENLRLIHWDSMHGEDRVFIICKHKAFEEIYEYEKDEPRLINVDLYAELSAMAKKWRDDES
jgi:hypothetical protein